MSEDERGTDDVGARGSAPGTLADQSRAEVAGALPRAPTAGPEEDGLENPSHIIEPTPEEIETARLAAIAQNDAAVDADVRRRTRRDFIVAGVAAAAGLGGWRWLTTRPRELKSAERSVVPGTRNVTALPAAGSTNCTPAGSARAAPVPTA